MSERKRSNADISTLYTPDFVLAEQFFDPRRTGLEGERSLMLAVLRDAWALQQAQCALAAEEARSKLTAEELRRKTSR